MNTEKTYVHVSLALTEGGKWINALFTPAQIHKLIVVNGRMSARTQLAAMKVENICIIDFVLMRSYKHINFIRAVK